MKTAIFKALLLIILFAMFSSCSLGGTITVTIYNNTSITTGTMNILTGDYSKNAEIDHSVSNPIFPYSLTVDYSAACPAYLVDVSLESSAGTSIGYVFFDTTAGGDKEGAINLMLYIVNGLDAYEPDNSQSYAHSIQAGEYQARSLTNTSDVDYAEFYATAGWLYNIDTVIPSSINTDTILYLYNSSGTELAYNDDYNGTRASHISWTATSSGIFYIKVGALISGPYGLTLSSSSPGASIKSPLLKLNEWLKR